MRKLWWHSAPFKNRKPAASQQVFANHESQTPTSSKIFITSSIRLGLTRLFNKKAIMIILALVIYSYVLLNTEYIYPSIINNTLKSINMLNEAEQVLGKTDPISVIQSTIASSKQKESSDSYVPEYSTGDLRTRLAKKYPYDRDSTIPQEVWQTWKEPVEKISNVNLLKYIDSWESQKDFNYHLVTDDKIESTITEMYVEFPEILDTLQKLPKNILKFDFLRYLILFAKGGIYSDIDTANLQPLEKWIDNPEESAKYFDQVANVGFVVGIEGDYDRADWKYKTARRLQFCQWTFKSKIGHPILAELIYSIVQTTLNDYNEKLNHVKIGTDYHTLHSIYTVLNWTGPGIFTDILFDYLNRIFKVSKIQNKNPVPHIKHKEFEYYHRERNEVDIEGGKFVGWSNFTKISSPVLFDDVMILPINSFNAFNEDMEIKADDKLTYVKHDFSGSWKSM